VFEEIFEVNRLLLHMATYQFQVKDALWAIENHFLFFNNVI
jgi:hypothetical protein